MNVNKVVYGGETLIDISDSTVTVETLAQGKTAYGANGEKITGTLDTSKPQISLTDGKMSII